MAKSTLMNLKNIIILIKSFYQKLCILRVLVIIKQQLS
jgi:hypothetical protein